MNCNTIFRHVHRFIISNRSKNSRCVSIGVVAGVALISGIAVASDLVKMSPEPAPAKWFDAEDAATAAEQKRLRKNSSNDAPASASISLAPPAAPAETGGAWIAQGPAVTQSGQTEGLLNNEVTGAIHTVVAHPTIADQLWIGSTNGGVWRTINATAASPTWTPLTDNFPGISIGALEADPTDPNTLLAGIGRFSSFGRIGDTRNGLLLTADGGTSWTEIDDPLLIGENISGVAIRGGLLLVSSNINGVFRRASAAASWVQISGAGTGLPNGAVFDLVGDSTASTRFYASVAGVGIYMSIDSGSNWTNISSGDATLSGIITAGGGAANNNTEMAVAADGRLYTGVMQNGQVQYIGFSDDQGVNWTAMDIPQVNDGGTIVGIQPREKPGSQGGVHFSIRVDPSSVSTVYVGGDRQDNPNGFPNAIGANSFSGNLYRGDTTVAPTGGIPSPQWEHLTHSNAIAAIPNGGTAGNSAPHADSREMVFDVNGNIIEVDDGGIYRRTSPGDNTGDWFSLNGNLQITEFHDIAYDTNSNIIFGGAQDTGTHQQNSPGGFTYTDVQQADGGDVAIDDTSVPGFSVRLHSIQNLGNFRRRVCDAGNTCVASNITPTVIGTGAALVAPFVTPLELNVTDQTRLIIGGNNFVYESADQGANITQLNGPAGDPIGGAGGQNAMIYGHPNNQDLIYVGSNSQLFIRTALGGNLVATPGVFPGGQIRDITVDPTDENIVYAIDSDQVFRTLDGGANWDEITGNIGDGGAASYRTIQYIEGTKDLITVGTDAGVLASQEPKFDRWFILGKNMPNVIVYDLDYDAADDILLAGTLGRGAWTLANPTDIPIPVITLPVTELDFGTVCGLTTGVLKVCNTGMANLQVDSITSSDVQFSVTVPSSGFPVIISPDFCFPFEVAFSPSSTGPASETLTITSNDPAEPTLDVPVNGILGEPHLVTVMDATYGDVCLGSMQSQPLTLLNDGACDLTVTNMSITADAEGEFSVATVINTPFVLQGGESVSADIEFTPIGDVGGASGNVRIDSDDSVSPTNIAVSGNSPAAAITTFIANSGSFNEVCSGDILDQNLTVQNSGACPLVIDSTGITLGADAQAGDFVQPDGNAAGATVTPGTSIEIPIRFAPSAFDAEPPAIRIATAHVDSHTLFASSALATNLTPISGVVPPPDINVAIANSGDFGEICKTDHADLDLTLFNQGKCDLSISAIDLLPDVGSFELPADLGMPLVLSPDADFTVPVRFAPEACFDSPENRTIKITSDDPDEMMVNVDISGVSPCPNLVIDPPAISGIYAFPATVADSTGTLGCFSERTTILRNNGACPLTIDSIAATGVSGDATDYTVTAPTVFPVILPTGEETLGVTVRFTPQADADPLAPSEVTGLMTVVSDDPDSSHTGELCGESVAQSGVRILVTDISSGLPVNVSEVDNITIQSKGKNRPGPINLQFTDQPVSSAMICGNQIYYHVDQETLPSTDTTGSGPSSSYQAKTMEGSLQASESFGLNQCEFRDFQLELQDSDAPSCLLLPKGEACTTAGQCCSGKCKGPSGAKTCK